MAKAIQEERIYMDLINTLLKINPDLKEYMYIITKKITKENLYYLNIDSHQFKENLSKLKANKEYEKEFKDILKKQFIFNKKIIQGLTNKIIKSDHKQNNKELLKINKKQEIIDFNKNNIWIDEREYIKIFYSMHERYNIFTKKAFLEILESESKHLKDLYQIISNSRYRYFIVYGFEYDLHNGTIIFPIKNNQTFLLYKIEQKRLVDKIENNFKILKNFFTYIEAFEYTKYEKNISNKLATILNRKKKH